MKFLILFFLIVGGLNESEAQTTEVSINKLLQLTQKSNFKDFSIFTKQLSYKVIDSSRDKSGPIFYFTMEPVVRGNILGCATDTSGKKISELTFTTVNKQYYIDFKEQLRKSGFTASKLNKSNQLPIIESQDFEKDKILVSTAMKKDDDLTSYEFTFIKF